MTAAAERWRIAQERAAVPGSSILTAWKAEREFMRVQNAGVSSSDNDAMRALFMPINSPSGFAVNDRTAMQVGTVFACLTKLGGAILQLPIEQYRMDAEGDRRPVGRTPLWWLLNESPSPAWTAASWKEWIVRCVHLRGDQHTEILRSKKGSSYGEIIGFKVHHPDYCTARRLDGRLVYDVQDLETGRAYTVDQDDMLHFTGFGFDGLRSISAIQHAARTAVGNALAAADYTGRTIGEGAMPQIALTYPGKVNDAQADLLRKSFLATYSGTGSRKLPLVLSEGAQVKELTISPVDMQLLQSRGFESHQICQAMGVPPVLIGDSEKTSSWGTGIEQITLGFVKFTVKPHLVRWAEELNRKIFRNAGPFLSFDLAGLLAGDSKAETEAFRAALGGPGSGDGWMSINEVRRMKNLPPDPDPDSNKPFKAQRAGQANNATGAKA